MIGYWDGPAAPGGLPDVCGFVDASDGDDASRRAVVAYLRAGTVFVVAAGVSVCRLCGIANGSAEQTDGQHFVWPEGLAHYVEAHEVRLPDDVVAVAERGLAPTAFPAAVPSIDLTWWAGLAGPAAGHLRGCRRSGSVAPWDLPDAADIYVDRVPADAVAVLVRIRRLLGASWPVAGLRERLGAQPFHAASGSPLQLYRALESAPELRPYLFYGAEADLRPVWSDA